MRKIVMEVPSFTSYASPEAASDYEKAGLDNFVPPLPVLIRTAYVGYVRDDRESEFEFTFPGLGVLVMRNRDYKFTPTATYAKRLEGTGRPLQGRW